MPHANIPGNIAGNSGNFRHAMRPHSGTARAVCTLHTYSGRRDMADQDDYRRALARLLAVCQARLAVAWDAAAELPDEHQDAYRALVGTCAGYGHAIYVLLMALGWLDEVEEVDIPPRVRAAIDALLEM